MGKEDYEVGFGKTPVGTRFKKGKSGNPNGRPKGSRNLASIVRKQSRERMRISGSRGL